MDSYTEMLKSHKERTAQEKEEAKHKTIEERVDQIEERMRCTDLNIALSLVESSKTPFSIVFLYIVVIAIIVYLVFF